MPHGKAESCTLLLLLSTILPFALARTYPRFSRNDTVFQHLALHPDSSVGTVYVGARDHLFQLDGLGGLRLEQEETTGPVSDSIDCFPPVTESSCSHGRRTSNYNKLLLLDPYAQELITCGSVHQGTCQKRSLASIQTVLFSTERPMDTQHVAANDPQVSTVGLVVQPHAGDRTVMYVGRGYVGRFNHPPISTRHLSSEPVFSYEETAKLAVAGRLVEYDHHFVTTFMRRTYVYFLFYRRDIKSGSREYRTYAARVCLDDTSYYSYVEVPLVCRSSSAPYGNYNLLQAAQVGRGADREGEHLLGVFSSPLSSSNPSPSDTSALCVFPLEELDEHINSTRDLCYTQDGRTGGGEELAYIEYEVKSSCANLPLNTLKAYPCGSDHTPSPMASRTPVEARAVWSTSGSRLTAVAVSVREGHSIAFLGDSRGTLHKVYLGWDGEVEVYANTVIHYNSPINSDLLLDHNGAHIYIMTQNAVEKRPVAECGEHTDCQSCLSTRDPYCGWCVLEGRCGQRWECRRGSVHGHWLWSFNQSQQCLSIQQLSLYNISRGEKTRITVSVEGLPSLSKEEAYSCFFHDTESPAILTNTGVMCFTPDADSLPPIRQGDDYVMVTLSLRFLNVTVAETEFTFYNCSLVQQLSGRRPCQGCVSSRWGCNWCLQQHLCTHQHSCGQGLMIYNQHFNPPTPTMPPPASKPASPLPTTITTTTTPITTAATTVLVTTATSTALPTIKITTQTVEATTTLTTVPPATQSPNVTFTTTSYTEKFLTQATTSVTATLAEEEVQETTALPFVTEKMGVNATTRTTLPSSTSGHEELALDPSGETVVSSSGVSPTTSSEIIILTEFTTMADRELGGEEMLEGKEAWGNGWDNTGEEEEKDSFMFAVSEAPSEVFEPTLETDTATVTAEVADYQSDSSVEPYMRVSGVAQCAI